MATRKLTLKEIEVKMEEIRKEMSVIKEDLANIKSVDKNNESESIKKQIDEINNTTNPNPLKSKSMK